MESHQTINLSRDRRNYYKRRISTISGNHENFERFMDFSSERSHSYIYDEGMEVSYMSNMNDKMSDVLIDTDTLKRDTNEMKKDITDVKNDVSTIKTDVNNLSTSFETSVESIKTNVNSIDANVSEILDAKFKSINSKIDSKITDIQMSTGKWALGIIVAIFLSGWIF